MNVSHELWNSFLSLKNNNNDTKNSVGWTFNGSTFSELKDTSEINSDTQAILIKIKYQDSFNTKVFNFKNIQIHYEGLTLYISDSLSENKKNILIHYWPLSVVSKTNTTLPHVFIHSAISLDGYIATNSGHSHWIGNEENLTHAHRLRALSDAVMIGGKTVLADKPSLNVRHVEGKNPKRLILSNRCDDLSALKKIADCKTYLLRDTQFIYDDCTNHFDKIISFNGTTKKEKLLDLLQKCKNENINSILIEGGGRTLSSFIETKLARIVQFHMSPMLFGCGIKAVQLPEVNLVNETHKLKDMLVTPIGNSFMVTAGLL